MPVMFLSSTTGGNGMSNLLSEVGTTLTTVLGWFGDIIKAMVTTDGDLNGLFPLLALGIVISVVFAGIKLVRSFAWGA